MSVFGARAARRLHSNNQAFVRRIGALPAPMAWMLRSHVHQGLGPAESKLFKELVVLYTYYDYLDLPPGASAARIEAAYQTIKQRLDAGTDETLVRLIHEAHALLSDPEQRHVYDEQLERSAAEADAELKALLDEQAKIPRTRRVQNVPTPLLAAIRAWAA
ncbi:MAG: hypothetical protein ABI541_10575 [Betaproteobacteria bacterium]